MRLPERTDGQAFGLDVTSAVPIAGLVAGAAGRGRFVAVELAGDAWPDGAEDVVAREGVRVEHDPAAGWRLSADDAGAAVVSADGRRVAWAPRDPADQAHLTGQVLPFAAALQGLEPLHASAVVLDGRAVAFAGPSGAGKTTLALALVRHGARPLADDVLALERDGDQVLAHPGIGLANVREASSSALGGPSGRVPLAAAEAAPLAVLHVLLAPDDPRLGAPVSAPLLLGATFNLVLRTPERLAAQLDLCAHLGRAADVRTLPAARPQAAVAVAERLLAEVAV